jgi:hypothetical protein
MSLKSLAQSAAKIAFDAAGDALAVVTYISKGAAVLNEATGVVTSTDVTKTGIRMLVESYGAVFGNETRVTDKFSGDLMATVIASELGVVPKTGDKVTMADGTQLSVTGARPADPTFSTYNLLLGKPE